MDTSRGIVTVEYAGFWIRLVSYVIDFALLSLISYLILTLVDSQAGYVEQPPAVPVAVEAASRVGSYTMATLISYLTSFAYMVGFWTWRGQTPGKMLLRIKIVRTDGSRVGLGNCILRYIGYVLSGFVLFIGYLWIAVDSEKQGIHDKIADTYVVRLPRKRARMARFYA